MLVHIYIFWIVQMLPTSLFFLCENPKFPCLNSTLADGHLPHTADGKASEVQDLLDGVFYLISSAEQQKSDPMMLKQKLSNLLTWSQLFNIWQLVCVIQRKTIHLCFISVHELYLDQNCWVFWSWIAHRVPRCPQDRCSHPNHSERWGSHLHTHSTHFTSLYYLFIFVYLKFTKSYYLQATRKLFCFF